MSSSHKKKKMGLLGRSMCGREPEKEIEQLSRDDGSQYSLTGGILPPLGVNGRNNRRGKLRAHIISPFDYNYRLWETFLIFLVLYTAWVCPFEFGFLDMAKGVLAITDNVVNGFFAIDIILTFFVAYLDKSSYLLVDDPKLIALRYVKTWLVFDVVSTIPSELARKILPLPVQTYGYFNMLRLWRLRRVSSMFARLEKDRNFNYFWVRCAKLIFVCLFAVHFAGCCFFLIASHMSDPKKTWMGLFVDDFRQESLWYCYVTSIYWSIVTLTTTGYGDLHPVNEKEMSFVICYLFFVLGLQAYLIGNMTNLVVHGTGRTRKFRDTIQAASNFAQRNQLPVRLQEQMLAHLCLKHRTDSEGLQQQETVDALPKAIRSSISHHLFYSLVDSVYLFNGVSTDLIFQLVTEMKAEYFPPKEDIILQNEAPTDFYIVVTGAADLIIQRNGLEEIVGEAKPGDVIGEIGVLCYRPQLFTVRTCRLSQLLRMNRTSFFNLVQASVGDGSIIMNNLLKHLREIKDPMMEEILQETQQTLTRSGMEMPHSLCYAANNGDDLLLHKLLKRGSHPNEVDNSNGKTPLHIAASKGNEHCVVLLLEYGADPNQRDFEGSTPLWEAIQGKHESIVKLLMDNGADISAGDIGSFACSAAEQNSTDMLKSLVLCGGDITQPRSNGTTALHMSVCEGNSEMVKLLLEQGGDIDKPDIHGWTPRALADQQGHEEIKELFSAVKQAASKPHTVQIPQSLDLPYMQKFQSESNMPRFSQESSMTPVRESNFSDIPPRRRRNNNYRNSLVGFMATANTGDGDSQPSASHGYSGGQSVGEGYRARVTISCPEKGNAAKLVLLPNSIQELLEIGAKKFGFYATKILTQEGAEIEDIDLIRDGDRLFLAGDAGATLPSSHQEL
ncbi:potassium channel AKT1 isoform X1 [Momordica charantia]|uniref:Potassium channel n=1 Tax=Momordica charantia TaxID=3673 RepID=A0A6J1BTX7_MOMCH|nr:potassium channel AKT1 isoform X1 [Momordica charantia]